MKAWAEKPIKSRRQLAGQSNKEIVTALNLSASTVKFHLQNIFTKLGVQDRTQATAVAFQRGIVRLGE